ncbi:hypothetical protein BD311DRAFT_767248 [Dichomitus squalens]|uniref:Uncharacterized protein n=1 Tax=Dichomitus squalens TaxID=114155 RepID=A0A4Q9MCK7_9APHY|nr:hypothetical protein BD311DRAFT_767248 [Dichomitus squalens]
MCFDPNPVDLSSPCKHSQIAQSLQAIVNVHTLDLPSSPCTRLSVTARTRPLTPLQSLLHHHRQVSLQHQPFSIVH